MKAVVVSIASVESIRMKLAEKGLLDRSRKILVVDSPFGKAAEIPIICDVSVNTASDSIPSNNDESCCDRLDLGISGYDLVEQINPEFYNSVVSLKESLKTSIPDDLLQYVPSGWHVMGNVVIVSIPDEVQKYKIDIAENLLVINPRCDCVVQDHGIKGPFREPDREILIGGDTETIEKENGCLFKIDVMKLMFSKGNLAEKKRMSKLGTGEVVIDMFSGIGYFSIPMAVHGKPKKIYSIELNPVSYSYLLENIKLNHQENVIEAINGNCNAVTPIGIADRVIMGYVGTTHEYLGQGISAIKKEGGILHYHETTPECLVFERPIQRIQDAAVSLGKTVEITGCHRIKKYSPGVWHVVVDAMIR